MKKQRDCTVLAQNYSQIALTFGEGQQINTHFRFIGNAKIVTYICAIPYSIHVLSSHDATVYTSERKRKKNRN